MFEVAGGNSSLNNIGARNVESVRMVLRKERIPILKEDVGSNYARTLSFDASTGDAIVKSFGKAEIKL